MSGDEAVDSTGSPVHRFTGSPGHGAGRHRAPLMLGRQTRPRPRRASGARVPTLPTGWASPADGDPEPTRFAVVTWTRGVLWAVRRGCTSVVVAVLLAGCGSSTLPTVGEIPGPKALEGVRWEPVGND